MPSAITTVFSTHELLESILLQVDLRTLLTSAQRVNRTWHDLIRSSLPLQRTLFFAPQDDIQKNTEYTYNPLLTNAFPTFFQSFPGPAAGRPKKLNLNSLEMVLRPDKQTAYLRAEASWRTMLTRQPPVRSLLAVRVTSSMAGDKEEMEWLEVPEGELRMGRVFELVMSRKVVSFQPITHIHLFWNPGAEMRAFQGSYMRVGDELRRAMVEADALLYTYHVVQCSVRWEDTAEMTLQSDLARGYGKIDL
ncbi:hypothetical protein P168DRAFT_316181 [Aspergillus campestris IBT 28561]|uniref:F-box domain-containing protein n=1 Tax=Aspergillus campestris (strain IBT 28561) TaxID=1392248 RepID=A0A2I1D8F1_ASPC2|nr:uncharacterized protein P168DRAFT_316181 [Aspergillus campestris IBT 28561]PKY06161.1 hypothetical protein P168DRAFT_316181 [Aspergillus campestris IBT 28561]